MGVPAFYRWLTEKYPKVVSDLIEKFSEAPLDLNEPNPNGLEFDNLYIDMNGIIHPCSHPEDRPAPATEEDMFCAVIDYVDRIFAAIRPRKVLFLAIDGVAPRAKMNQQRARRFKAIQERKEHEEVVNKIREEMAEMGLKVPPKPSGPQWDSNVITPGTEFMDKLATYVFYAIVERMNTNSAWQKLTVIFSDASDTGEGEHKIMNYIRAQRAQPGYNPNTRHVLHGLDADLIMLGLATHEPHFYILREEVIFGKKDQNRQHAQERFDAVNQQVEKDNLRKQNNEELTNEQEQELIRQKLIQKGYKPLQILHIPILREYLSFEFGNLKEVLTFEYNFERIIDDFVFLMFFVGNDFLPHLPSMDIRDGAIDFLYNIYKRLLPTFDGYLTKPGGDVDLKKVSALLSEVGEVENEIFYRRKLKEEEEAKRKSFRRGGNDENKQKDNRYQNAGKNRGIQPVGKNSAIGGNIHHLVENTNQKNSSAAEEIRQRLATKRKKPELDEKYEKNQPIQNATQPRKKLKKNDGTSAPIEINQSENNENPNVQSKSQVLIHEIEEEINLIISQSSEDDNEEEEIISIQKKSLIAITKQEVDEASSHIKTRVQQHQQQTISKNSENVQDNVKFGEEGWKDRYYSDKYKDEDITTGGGRQKVYQSYIEGLCWIMKYYYQGCVSWKWFYPFHYAPFASDLVDTGDLNVTFEESNPFTPIQQLLAVLPKESAAALPTACKELITDSNSILSEFFPEDVSVDPNGKILPWLWVILLPFIDENRLITALNTVEDEFTEDEHRRNSFGPSYLFVHSSHALFPMVKDLYENNKNQQTISIENFDGFSATLATPSQSKMTHLNQKIITPKRPVGYFNDIAENQVICVEYKNPEYSNHLCELLTGARIQDPVLEPSDVMFSKCPRLNRGFSIADLGKKDDGSFFNYRGIDKDASNRMVSHSINNRNWSGNSYQSNNWENSQPRSKYQKYEYNSNNQYSSGRSHENYSSSRTRNPKMTSQPYKFNAVPPPPPPPPASYEPTQNEFDSTPQQNVSSDQELRYQLQQTINQKKAQQFKFDENAQDPENLQDESQHHKQGQHQRHQHQPRHHQQQRQQQHFHNNNNNLSRRSQNQQYRQSRYQSQEQQQHHYQHNPHQHHGQEQPQQHRHSHQQNHPQSSQHPQRNGKRHRT